MPRAEIQLPDGRRALLEGPTREAIMQQAQRLTGDVGRDPRTGNFDPDLAMVDRAMRTPAPQSSPRRAPLTLPFGLGQFSVGGPAADAVRGASNISDENALMLTGGTIGSIAAPPLAAGAAASRLPMLLNALSRGAQRFGPPIVGSGTGGAVGGGVAEAQDPNATPASIGRAALESGATMAAAEAGGMGLAGAGAALLAPARAFPPLRHFDPFKPVRNAVQRFVRDAPSRTSDAIKAAEEMHPGTGAAARVAAERLKDLARRVTKDGEVLTERLRDEWASLTPKQREVFGTFERFSSGVSSVAKRAARMSRTDVGMEILELTAIPAAATLLGPGAGVVLWGLKQAVAPGPLMRHFSRQTLPGGPVTQTLTGQGARMVPRVGVLEEQ